MTSLAGKTLFITGASRGIGLAIARRAARDGANVVIAAKSDVANPKLPGTIHSAAAQVEELGGRALAIRCDIREEEQVHAAVDKAVATFGGIDILVNNASAIWLRGILDTPMKRFDLMNQVNARGTFLCSQACLPHLLKSKGRIVGIASLTALVGVPTRTGYAASKHAMRGFFDSLRIELSDSGVSVTMVYPGFVATGIRENATGADGKPAKVDPVNKEDVMSVEDCVGIIMSAIESRKREEVMTFKGKLGQWVKLIAPGVIDGMAKKAVEGNQKYVEQS